MVEHLVRLSEIISAGKRFLDKMQIGDLEERKEREERASGIFLSINTRDVVGYDGTNEVYV